MFALPFAILEAKAKTYTSALDLGGVGSVIDTVIGLMNKVVPLLIGIAVLVFLWGVLKYVIAGSDDAGKRAEARGFMIWGIVSIFIMVSVWGLVGILQTSFGIDNTGSGIDLPSVVPAP
jgi:hypothetical protein